MYYVHNNIHEWLEAEVLDRTGSNKKKKKEKEKEKEKNSSGE